MDGIGTRMKLLIGALAVALVAAGTTAVVLGVQSAGRGKDLAASTTQLRKIPIPEKDPGGTDGGQKRGRDAGRAACGEKAAAEELKTQKETEITGLKAQLTEKENQRAALETQLQDAQKQMDDGAALLETAKSDAARLQAQLKDAQTQLSNAKTQLDAALSTKTQLEAKGAEDAEAIEALASVSKQYEEAKAEVETLQTSLETAQQDLAGKAALLDEATKQVADLTAKLNAAVQSETDAKDALTAAQEDLAGKARS
jgi:chromosome segregation ATPase